MEKIVWSKEFEIGIHTIDTQHRRIVNVINDLIGADSADVRSEVISDTLTKMVQYAKEHFADEERILAEHDYPDLEQQKREHRAFMKKAVEFCSATAIHVEPVPDMLREYLREWWTVHIQEGDMAYREFLVERGVR